MNAGGESCVLAIKVQPRAKSTAIRGLMPDGRLKISLTAPPADGKANQALIAFLAKQLGLHKSQIQIKSGFTAREKLVAIDGLNEAAVLQLLGVK